MEYRRERADMIQVYKTLYVIDKADKEKLFRSLHINKGTSPEAIQKKMSPKS